MGQRPRQRPQHLAAKLVAIRQKLGLSQPKFVKALAVNVSYHRICEYEKGVREPNVIALLRYAKLAGISTDDLIDDDVQLKF
jgi:transcriptional regulator with XRE-family HTH domain